MDENKQREEVSLIGRILSLEALLLLMGQTSLVYGIFNAELMNVAIGAGIIVLIMLFMHRKRSRDRNFDKE